MWRVKIKILKTFTRKIAPRFVFKKGQLVECICNKKEVNNVRMKNEYYKLLSIEKVI